MKCPVCETAMAQETGQCPNKECGFTVALPLDNSSETRELVRKRVEAARAVYAKRRGVRWVAGTEYDPTHRVNLARDPLETREEWRARLAARPVFGGKGALQRERYNIDLGLFPLTIISCWVDPILQGLTSRAAGSILANRDEARALLQEGGEREVFLRLDVVEDRPVVRGVEFVGLGTEQEIRVWTVGMESVVGTAIKDSMTGMELVWVPGGEFQMGNHFGTGNLFGEGWADENPVHKVKVDGFWLGKYPVMQGQWRSMMGNNPSKFPKEGTFPVENVSWDDVQVFINTLHEKTGRKYRLPTEAEWEYAARSGGKRERYAGGEDIDRLGWHSGNSGGMTHPVGQKAPNGLGLHDMSGNVLEWCSDWYGKNYYAISPRDNPTGPSGSFWSTDRVSRGGSWNYDHSNTRTAYRCGKVAGTRDDHTGFRLALPGR